MNEFEECNLITHISVIEFMDIDWLVGRLKAILRKVGWWALTNAGVIMFDFVINESTMCDTLSLSNQVDMFHFTLRFDTEMTIFIYYDVPGTTNNVSSTGYLDFGH